jgi:hypothetical protein
VLPFDAPDREGRMQTAGDATRRLAFAVLVAARDGDTGVAVPRRAVAERSGLSEAEVLPVERGGIEGRCPPGVRALELPRPGLV